MKNGRQHLRHASENDVVHHASINVVSRDKLIDNDGTEITRMDLGLKKKQRDYKSSERKKRADQKTIFLAARCPDSIYDVGGKNHSSFK